MDLLANILKFVFTHINEYNWDEEFSFVVDVSAEKEYHSMLWKVIMVFMLINISFSAPVYDCQPMLPRLNEQVKYLNESRDFYRYLKEMRKAFVELVKASRKSQ
jgi:hypothetical protein